jgi:hypothetical protein
LRLASGYVMTDFLSTEDRLMEWTQEDVRLAFRIFLQLSAHRAY